MKLNIVPPSTGLLWVRLGMGVFRRQPLALAMLFFFSMAALSIISALPLLGPVIALGLLPSTTLAMMVAAARASDGQPATPGLLLVAFRSGAARQQAMLTLGALYAVGFLLVIGASALVDGGVFASAYLGSTPMSQEVLESDGFMGAMWLAMLLYIPLSMLFWHAPGLVYWHAVSPVKALFFSLVACWRNLGALTIYALSWMGVFMIAGVLLTMVVTLLGFFNAGAGLATGMMLGIALLLASMFFSSIVFTFRDSFAAPETEAAKAAETPEESE